MGFLKKLFFGDASPKSSAPASEPADPYALETPLLAFSPHDAWTLANACEGTQIFGSTGSGKTSGSGAAIAQSFLRHGFGGLVLCAKPDERALWEKYAERTGRTASLVVVSPESDYRFNFLRYELLRKGGGGQTDNLVQLLSDVTTVIEGRQTEHHGDPFWEESGQRLLRNAIELIALSGEPFTLDFMYRLVLSAPRSPEQAKSPAWEKDSICAQCLNKAAAHVSEAEARGDRDARRKAHDFDQADMYWCEDYPTIPDKTRGGIIAHVASMVDKLMHGITWEMLSDELTIVPEITYQDGAVIILDVPISKYQHVGRIVQGVWKLMFQRAVKTRNVQSDPRPVFLWADESQNFISPFDAKYQGECRSAKGCTVYLTQNISNYYSVLGANGHDEAHSLLGNFQTKIFHAQSDHATNQYAADLIGQDWMLTTSTNTGNQDTGGSSHGATIGEGVHYKVLPSTFTKLRKGGRANNLEVDGIVVQGGRVWQATGDTYLPTVFKQ